MITGVSGERVRILGEVTGSNKVNETFFFVLYVRFESEDRLMKNKRFGLIQVYKRTIPDDW